MGVDSSLSSMFHSLYCLSSMKNCLVVDVVILSGGSPSYSLGFCHSLTNRETREITTLLSLIGGCQFRVGRRDVYCWSVAPSKGFLCSSFFRWLGYFVASLVKERKKI